MSNERIPWIDVAKGLVILCVFIGHTISTPSNISTFVYFFHIPAFFMLSGYCFSNRRRFKDFVKVKAKTLLLPVLTIGLTGSLLSSAILNFIKDENVDWKGIIISPFIQYSEHCLTWFLPTLFVVLILFYGITKCLKDKPIFMILLSFFLAGCSYVYIKLAGYAVPWHLDTALIALPFAACGYGLKKSDKVEKLGRFYITVICFLLCFSTGLINRRYFGTIEMHTNLYGNIVLFYISALSGSLMIISLSMLINKNKMVEYFGRNSLVFYALEPIQYFANFAIKLIYGLLLIKRYIFVDIVISILAVSAITAVCSVSAYIINKYLPFMVGKNFDKRRNSNEPST